MCWTFAFSCNDATSPPQKSKQTNEQTTTTKIKTKQKRNKQTNNNIKTCYVTLLEHQEDGEVVLYMPEVFPTYWSS